MDGPGFPTRVQQFTNVSVQAGLSGYKGDNLAWGDYNNDGYLDLLVRGPSSNYLFRNEGDGTFTEVSNATGVNITRGYSQWADYNADGYLDFYTAGNDDHLFRNNGPPNWDFTDVTSQAGNPSDGLPTEGIAWVDYDRDGYPDIFTVGWRKPGDLQWPYAGERDRLYHNNGDGTFTDVSSSAGLRPRSTSYAGMGVVMCDPNEDGWPDIYVSNYHLNPNQLWVNNRDGTFTDMAFQYNLTGKATVYQGNTYYGHCNGAGWADYDNDQDMDVWVSHLAHKDDERSGMNRGYYCADSQLFENSGPPGVDFTDVRVEAGIPITPSGTIVQDPETGDPMWKDEDYFGVAWGDYDNDGDLDLWVPQVKTYSFWDHSFLWENDGDKTFSDSTDASGLKVWSNTGGTWVDHDNDGDLDFCTEGTYPFRGPRELHLFENPGTSGHWLELDLNGAGGAHQTSKDAIGTKVVVKSGADTFTRYVGGDCGGHGFQQPQRLHFGLGSQTSIDEMFVYWTSGRIQRFSDVSVDQLLTIEEPTTQHVDLGCDVLRYEVTEDERVTIDVNVSGAPVTNMYWDMDNDRIFETEVSSEDIDLIYNTEGKRWLRFMVRDTFGTYWDLEPIIINVSNVAPAMTMPEELLLREGEAYELDLRVQDTASDLRNLTIEWRIGEVEWTEGGSVKELLFEDIGTYTVSARVTDDNGEQVEKNAVIEVVNRVPEVSLHASHQTLEEDSNLELRAEAMDSRKDLDRMEYRFHSGDGRSTGWTEENHTSFIYREKGKFAAGVEVRDRHGETASDLVNIEVINLPPEIWFRCTENVTDEDSEVIFELHARDTHSDLEHLQYRLDHDDGLGWSRWRDYAGSEHDAAEGTYMEMEHVFTGSGTHNVKVQVKDDDGDISEDGLEITVRNVPPRGEIILSTGADLFEDTPFTLTADLEDTPSDIEELEHRWLFSDGTGTEWSDSDPYIEHIFRDIGQLEGTWVKLFIRDDDQVVNVTEHFSVRTVPPEADLSVSARTINEDETVVLDASGSTDSVSDMDHLEFVWMINSEVVEGGSVLRYTFTTSGIYKVEVTVTDDDGESSLDTATITVNNVVPVVVIDIVDSANVGESVIFDASGSFDTPSDMEKLSFTFDPGDGSEPMITSGSIVNHTYSEPGIYEVEITVSDGDAVSSMQESISIRDMEVPAQEEKSSALLIVVIVGSLLILLLLAGLLILLALSRRSKASPPPPGQHHQVPGPPDKEVGSSYSTESPPNL